LRVYEIVTSYDVLESSGTADEAPRFVPTFVISFSREAFRSSRTMRIASPITWFGGKSRLAPRIVKYFPPHRTYVEPFGGSAAVLLAKEPSSIEVFNDIDKQLFNLFRVLRHEPSFRQLQKGLELTLYSRAEFDLAKQQSNDPVEAARRLVVRQRQSRGGLGDSWSYCVQDAHAIGSSVSIEAARCLLVRQRQSFSGNGKDWSYSTKKSQGGVASAVKRWRKGIDVLPAVHRRLRNVQIECDDWRKIIPRFDSLQTLFYVDAPYHSDTRVGGRYRHELSNQDHKELIARLLKIRGMVALSGYNHVTYEPLERTGWKRIDFDVVANVSYKRASRTESLWLSPSVVNQKSHLFLSAAERMREGAYQTHSKRVDASTRRVTRAIEKFRARGEKVTITGVARTAKISREHLTRYYRHLITV
jgi:DNA adenine methylase